MVRGAATLYRLGIDIGGTFTDVVLNGGDGSVHTCKVSTTPDDYGRGIVTGVSRMLAALGTDGAAIESVVHGTTVATNAILEQRGARTALITTLGFRDVLEMRRLRIPEMYTLNYRRPDPLVPRHLRFEVEERLGPRGEVWRPLNAASLAAAIRALAAAEVESVAIALLHSYANPAHEREVAAAVAAALPPDVFVTCSSDILPEIREYERTSTTVINAYLGPILARYFRSLERHLASIGITAPLHVMKSDGGIMTLAAAVRRPAYIVESGPSAGVIGAARSAELSTHRDMITLDMGGTTAKAAMIEDGRISRTSDYEVGAGINLSSRLVMGGGHALKLPVIDISEIGAGGGSIVALDRAGGLQVGPRSAGAVPGPVAYDAGGEVPTFTDAALILGYLNPERLAGGEVRLNKRKAEAVLRQEIADPIGRSLLETAYGIYAIAASSMVRAVKAVSTYRGRDPRDFVLFAFGGNGPLVAAEIAKLLQMRRIVVPSHPGVFSALGLLLSDIEHESSRSVMSRLDRMGERQLVEAFADLEAATLELMRAESDATIELHRFADLRYDGQAHELTVPVADSDFTALAGAFRGEHERTYGHQSGTGAVECVNLRVRGRIAAGRAPTPRPVTAAASAGPETRREAYFGPEYGVCMVPIIGRATLAKGSRRGPLIIEEYDATCVVPPDWRAECDAFGQIILSEGEEG